MSALNAPRPLRSSQPRNDGRARLSVVAPPSRARGNRAFLLLCATILIAALLGVLGLNTLMARNSFEQHEMEKRLSEALTAQDTTQEAITRAQDPREVARKARELGLAPAQQKAFIRLSDGSMVAVAVPESEPMKEQERQQAAAQATGQGDQEAGRTSE